ncbi:MAG: tRNA1(Val) (adenine(37)-N6)-methyltransferase [Clostridia bacterium]|nr:tRNA1(Val) (adenine(37)-N6)-methyltransferase [Clostridia bacterium]
MDGILLKENERLDDLQNSGCRLIQRPDSFRFGTDSVLLADFASPRSSDRCADLGCGTGAIATLMALHCPGIRIDAVEIQEDIADMALRSVQMNGLADRIRVHAGDMREAWRTIGAEKCTLAVCNPPYGRAGGGLVSRSRTQLLARHESGLTPDEIAESASRLLRTGGRFCVIYPAPRIFEMMTAMQAHRLAPKRIRTVHGVEGHAPKLILLDAVKGGGDMLHWLEPLVLQRSDGSYTEEWKRIYRVREDTERDRP